MNITFDDYGVGEYRYNMIPVNRKKEYHLHIHYEGYGLIHVTDEKNNVLNDNKPINSEILIYTENSKYLFIEFINIDNLEIKNMYLNGDFEEEHIENKFTIKYNENAEVGNFNKENYLCREFNFC